MAASTTGPASAGRARLLFIAHREEILDQSLATFRYALRDASFGEMWVGGARTDAVRPRLRLDPEPQRRDLDALPSGHFDVVIVDEFHHAAAPRTNECSTTSPLSSCSG